MKINEILVESQQLDEGPVGDTLGKIGRGIGKVAGGVSKGVGAVAGGVAGLGTAFKKGFQSGKATVSGEPDPNAATTGQAGTDSQTGSKAAAGAPAGSAAGGGQPGSSSSSSTTAAGGTPAQTTNVNVAAPGGSSQAAAPTTTADINKAGPQGTAAATAPSGAGGAAINKMAQATAGQSADKAGQTLYATVKSQVNQLDKKGKQRILQLLQKSLTQPAPAAPAAAPAAKPATGPGSATAPAGPGAAPRTEPDLNAPAAKPAAGEQPTTAAGKKKPAPRKPAAPSQAEIDADRARIMGATSDSKINTGNPLAETLAQKIEQQKQRMFEKDLMIGKTKIFKQ